MFDLLTVSELDELADALDNAIYDVRHEAPLALALRRELEHLQHEVWHVRCEKTNCRCLHKHERVLMSV